MRGLQEVVLFPLQVTSDLVLGACAALPAGQWGRTGQDGARSREDGGDGSPMWMLC